MPSTITRRRWAASLAASAIPAAARPSQQKAAAEKLLEQAKDGVRESAEKLHKFPLPMATEPAFVFKP